MPGVLIGIDSSQASERALRCGLEIAAAEKVPVVIVHAIPWSPYSFTTAEENERRAAVRDQELAAAQEQLLDPALARAANAAVPAEAIVKHAHPVDLLVDIAEERQMSHIVIGRTGESRVKHLLFGGVPGRLIAAAPVPVTVVP
jgi:nucleotide-binding universal stress UspA family protein